MRAPAVPPLRLPSPVTGRPHTTGSPAILQSPAVVLLEDSFAAFVRTPRTRVSPRFVPASPTLSPKPRMYVGTSGDQCSLQPWSSESPHEDCEYRDLPSETVDDREAAALFDVVPRRLPQGPTMARSLSSPAEKVDCPSPLPLVLPHSSPFFSFPSGVTPSPPVLANPAYGAFRNGTFEQLPSPSVLMSQASFLPHSAGGSVGQGVFPQTTPASALPTSCSTVRAYSGTRNTLFTYNLSGTPTPSLDVVQPNPTEGSPHPPAVNATSTAFGSLSPGGLSVREEPPFFCSSHSLSLPSLIAGSAGGLSFSMSPSPVVTSSAVLPVAPAYHQTESRALASSRVTCAEVAHDRSRLVTPPSRLSGHGVCDDVVISEQQPLGAVPMSMRSGEQCDVHSQSAVASQDEQVAVDNLEPSSLEAPCANSDILVRASIEGKCQQKLEASGVESEKISTESLDPPVDIREDSLSLYGKGSGDKGCLPPQGSQEAPIGSFDTWGVSQRKRTVRSPHARQRREGLHHISRNASLSVTSPGHGDSCERGQGSRKRSSCELNTRETGLDAAQVQGNTIKEGSFHLEQHQSVITLEDSAATSTKRNVCRAISDGGRNMHSGHPILDHPSIDDRCLKRGRSSDFPVHGRAEDKDVGKQIASSTAVMSRAFDEDFVGGKNVATSRCAANGRTETGVRRSVVPNSSKHASSNLHGGLTPQGTHPDPAQGSPDSLQCDICGNSFARKSNLLKHKRSVHATTRKYACSLCGFAFKRYDHLSKHLNSTHLKRRAYPCSICPSAFAEKFNRDKHVRLHWQVRPFQCPCGAYFQRREFMEGCLRCKRIACENERRCVQIASRLAVDVFEADNSVDKLCG